MSRQSRTAKPARKSPTLNEIRRGWAESGDFEALFAEILARPAVELDKRQHFDLLLQALEVRASRDPAEFAEALVGRMMGLVAMLVLRAELYTTLCLRSQDERSRGHGHSDLDAMLIEKLLPRLLQLQGHFAELAQSQAATARLWKLAGRGPGPESGSRRARRSRPSRHSENGHAPIGPDRDALLEFLARAKADGRWLGANLGPLTGEDLKGAQRNGSAMG